MECRNIFARETGAMEQEFHPADRADEEVVLKLPERHLSISLMAGLMTLLQVIGGVTTDGDTVYCRDSWVDEMSYEDFAVYSCSKCFVQVFWAEKDLIIKFPPRSPYLLLSASHPDNVTAYYPDAESDQSVVCAEKLTSDECQMWRDCCQAAKRCCLQTQQRQGRDRDNQSCPSTWDGISCWQATAAGQMAQHSCPSYYELDTVAWMSPQVYRQCVGDGSWHINPNTSQEYSSYDECFDLSRNLVILRVSLYIDFAGNGISISALSLAILIIITIRNLRIDLQQRTGLRIHFNLFVSMLCSAFFTVALHSVYHDAFTSSQPMYQDNTVWCRALHIMTKYFKSTTYMAMFCEGLFLYRRISQVMQIRVSESMVKYLVITWIFPAITMAVYVIARLAAGQNKRCWIDDNGLSLLEYIHMIPNICSLICNLGFLICIEYMLCSKMRSDTSDRRVEVFRHAIRATLSLIPVFGIQFIFLIYRPKYWPPYEIIVAICESTQGTLVAVLYCFTTKEVTNELQRCRSSQPSLRLQRSGLTVGTTNSIKVVLTQPASGALPGDEVPSARFKRRVCKLICTRPSRSRYRRGRSGDAGENGLRLEVMASRRDSCESRLTQRSCTESVASSAPSQCRWEPRKNGPARAQRAEGAAQDAAERALLDDDIERGDVARRTNAVETRGHNKRQSLVLSPIDETKSHTNAEM